MTFCIDMKFPNSNKWITVSYERALEDRRASSAVTMKERNSDLSTFTQEPDVVEKSNEERQGWSGPSWGQDE